MSAQRAPETTSIADRTVLLPGSPATFANREVLKGMGLRWDPANHRWHGTTTAERVRELRERRGLEVRVFGQLEATPKGPDVPSSPSPPRERMPLPHDSSRTRVEARIAIPSLEEVDEIQTPTRRFTVHEITSGLPDDSCEADQRAAEERLRELRGRVKAARAEVATTPGLAELLRNDWRRAAGFYARFGISESMFRGGASSDLLRTVLAFESSFMVHDLHPVLRKRALLELRLRGGEQPSVRQGLRAVA